MKKTSILWIVMAVAVAIGIAGLSLAAKDEVRNDVLYTCGCGPSCACKTASVTPGKCGCGKPLVWGHVVKVEGNDALVCSCKEGCTCKLDEKNPGKCTCGHDLKRLSLVGTGLYFCNCGGSCTCNHISDKPGKCHCGMELKQATVEKKAS